jgi:outer membrane protein
MKTLAWVVVLALSGCALTNPTDPYAPVRGGYSVATPNRLLTAKAWSDRVARPLSLADCVQIALENNPQVGAQSWDVEAAEAQTDAASAQRWPALRAVSGYRHHLDDQRLIAARKPNEPGAWSSDIFSSDLVVSMPLFTGGRIVNEIGAAELLERAASHRLARTKSELVFNVSSTFYAILGQRRVIESLEFSRKALEEHRKRVQDFIAVQKAARVDLLRTEVRLADLEQRLVRERNTLAIQNRVLANLMGIPAEGPLPEVGGELERPETSAMSAGDIATALAQRDDYEAARRELEAQAKRVDAARAGHWPTVSLDATYGGRWAAHDVNRQPGADRSEDVGSVGVSISIPLFEGGRIESGVRREKARLASAQENLRKLELQIGLEVQSAVLNVTSSLERVHATEKAIEQAQESLRIEQEKYGLGKGSITDVLDAQSALLDSQTNYYRALADYSVALAQLRLATGAQK